MLESCQYYGTPLRNVYTRGYLATDFASLVKTRGKDFPERNKALSITGFKALRKYLFAHTEDDFNVIVLLALETGMRRGELLGIRPEDLYKYGIQVRKSISPTSSDISLRTKKSERDISINKDIYEILKAVPIKENGYYFDPDNFHQSAKLTNLLYKLNISRPTFHGLRDTHKPFLFLQVIELAYVSKHLRPVNIQTTQDYCLELTSEKKHQQDADALTLLNSLTN